MRKPSLAEWWAQHRGPAQKPYRISPETISTLARQLEQRDPHDASPLQLPAAPESIQPLLNAVNGLIQRTAQVIAAEQRFGSVAAHEIKTPLAGIRAQAQMAKRAGTEAELQEALHMVMAGVDQVARVLDQLQDLNRMHDLAADGQAGFGPVNLQSVYLQVQPELRSLLYGRHIRLVDATGSHWLEGAQFGLYLIMRNLLANAILYTPEQGVVEVSTSLQDGQLVLCVDDSGPGIAEADRPRLFQRYGRLHRFANEGIGLGLYIVKQAVELHGARISLLTSPLGGLRAQVIFAPSKQVAHPN